MQKVQASKCWCCCIRQTRTMFFVTQRNKETFLTKRCIMLKEANDLSTTNFMACLGSCWNKPRYQWENYQLNIMFLPTTRANYFVIHNCPPSQRLFHSLSLLSQPWQQGFACHQGWARGLSVTFAKQWKFPPVIWADNEMWHEAIPTYIYTKQSQKLMPAYWRPCFISHRQTYFHQAKTV